jgi:hypothetical protein
MGIIANTWQKLTGKASKSKGTQAKTGAGPAVAAHSKDASTGRKKGQSTKASKKKA